MNERAQVIAREILRVSFPPTGEYDKVPPDSRWRICEYEAALIDAALTRWENESESA